MNADERRWSARAAVLLPLTEWRRCRHPRHDVVAAKAGVRDLAAGNARHRRDRQALP